MAETHVHRSLGRLLQGVGGLSLLSAAAVNPWAGAFYHDPLINYLDVLTGYFYWSVGTGLSLAAVGTWIFSSGRGLTAGLLLAGLAAVLLTDRLLLAILGLPYWVPDPNLHYRHRPNAERVFAYKTQRAYGQPLSINSLGWHDDEFPPQKPQGQYRGLIVGDSIVMGWGVPHAASFANRLEQWLIALDRPAQIINAGVEGYSTAQERMVAEQGLAYGPDFIAVGFCMNDINHPYIADGRLGGTGVDHEGIAAANYLSGWLMNETGYGRLVQWARAAQYARTRKDLIERYGDHEMIARPVDDPKFKAGWDTTLNELEKIYALGRDRGLPVYLLIFPLTAQLMQPDLGGPQRTLKDHARRHGAYPIDLTPLLEHAVATELQRRILKPDELPPSVHAAAVEVMASVYFLDGMHLTREGHRLVASFLLQALIQYGHVEVDLARARRAMATTAQHRVTPFVAVPATRDELDVKQEALRALGMGAEAEKLAGRFAARHGGAH